MEYHLKKDEQRRIAEAVDRLLALPEKPAPENWEEWESEYLNMKYASDNPAGHGPGPGSA